MPKRWGRDYAKLCRQNGGSDGRDLTAVTLLSISAPLINLLVSERQSLTSRGHRQLDTRIHLGPDPLIQINQNLRMERQGDIRIAEIALDFYIPLTRVC